ncbi:MAG TPA: cyclopropane-fatty-acyl-phospholipid synthase family protein [Alphaproteobacteria bacterium]|nr:cyclopropane-fatty-acyl-phospholipid synthase family protein [Alphaproteobacteria bacterium]
MHVRQKDGDAGSPASLARGVGLLLRAASGLRYGELSIVAPNGATHLVAGPESGPHASLIVKHARAAWRFAIGGAVGLAEAYMDGDWETPDLPALLTLAAINDEALLDSYYGARWASTLRRLWHAGRANTRAGSRRNIAHHYDLGNAFYERWLDGSMTYSSAVFVRDDETLAEAQLNKYRRIAEKLEIAPHAHVLEIGCGWGGFARLIAREFGARVTAITVSRQQHDYARKRAQEDGLADRIDVRLVDYRDIDGRFDRIASIEMFEAVGERYWPVFFAKLRDNLNDGGRAALQVITIADRWFDSYRRSVDFIQRYIFPGGMLPSPTALRRLAEQAGLAVTREEFFGPHYARTLAEWQRRFQDAWPDLIPMGFDRRFKRMWEYYLAYCEAGFRAGSIDVTQVALVRR